MSLVKIYKRLESIDKTLNNMDKTLVKQQSSLDEHMRRTANLETRLEPIEAHKEQMIGASKLIGSLALLATIISAFIWL